MKLLHYTQGAKTDEGYLVLEKSRGPWPVIEAGFTLHCIAEISKPPFADLDHLPTGKVLR